MGRTMRRGVAGGGRNDALARLCGSWFSDGLSLKECIDMARIWNAKNDPPLPEEEMLRTVKSIQNRHNFQDSTKQLFYHERNFLRFPLFTRNPKKTHKNEELRVSVHIKHNNTTREWAVVPSVRWGLPGVFDETVFMAINKIISEMPKPVQNPIDIGSLRNIANIIGQTLSGRTTKMIKESLLRLKFLNILSEMTYYDANRKRFVTDAFGLFDRIVFTGEILPDGDEKSRSTLIWLNSVYLKNVNVNYTAPVDFDLYLSLKSFIAKGIYRSLVSLMPAGRGIPIKISYDRLADKLQIHKEIHLSQVKNQLNGAHNELVERGLFRKISFFESGKSYIISYLP